MVAQSYARGKAINMAAYLEIDDVIDPADTRRWIMRGYQSLPPRKDGQPEIRDTFVDHPGDQPAAAKATWRALKHPALRVTSFEGAPALT